MHTKRSKMSMVDSGGSLYVMGGFDGSTTINSVECYNPATNRFVFYVRRKNALSPAISSLLEIRMNPK